MSASEDTTDVGELIQQYLLDATDFTTVAGTRLRPDVLDQNDELPAATYETTFKDSQHHLGGASDGAFTRLRINCYAATRLEANRLAAIVRDLLHGYTGPLGVNGQVTVHDCMQDNEWDTREQPSDGSGQWRFCRNQDYLISHTEPVPGLTPIDEE